MEPTLYKRPHVYKSNVQKRYSVYKGVGVYKGVNVSPHYYYTLFQNFDFASKIDYPIIGEPTQYETENNYVYANDTLMYSGDEFNALNIKNSSNAVTQKNLIPLKLNSYTEFLAKIDMVSSSAPLFIWTIEHIGFFVDLNKGNTIGILSPSTVSDYESKNGAHIYNVSYGVRWFLTPLANNAVFKFRIDYFNDKTICSVDGVDYVVFNTTNTTDTSLKIDPRMGNKMSITDINCYMA